MVWRCRNSAAANRRALHSDYTSATEKTPTPLNGRCTRPQNPSCFAPTRVAASTCAASSHARDQRAQRRKFFDTSKTLMKSSVFAHIANSISISRARRKLHSCDNAATAQIDGAVSVLPRSKNFSTDAPFRGIARTVHSIKNERIERQVIRVATCVERVHRNRSRAKRFRVHARETFSPPRALTRSACSASKSELALEQFVHGLRVGLAAGGLHHLSDEPADRLRVGFRRPRPCRDSWRRSRPPPSRSRPCR